MSAIFGVINFTQDFIDNTWVEKIRRSYSEYNFDRIEENKASNFFFSNNIQWIIERSIDGTGMFETDRYILNGDIILDNRYEIIDKLNKNNIDSEQISDAELFLMAYEQWGKMFCEKLYGDYVFTIYDKLNDILLVGRDHVGNRILYYTENEGQFIYSSLKTTLCLPNQYEKLDHINKKWLAIFLENQSVLHHFDSVSTQYNNVFILEPSCILEVSKRGILKTKFWKPEKIKTTKMKRREYFVSLLKDAVKESVKARCNTKGKVGGMLSGGLDSSTIASIACSVLKDDLKLYSYTSIPSQKFNIKHHPSLVVNESEWVRQVSNKYQNVINHYSSNEGLNSINIIDETIDVYQMPYKFVENSYWLLSLQKKAKEDGCLIYLNGNSGNTVMSNGRWEQVMFELIKKGKWISLYKEICYYSKIFKYSKAYIVKYFVKSIYIQVINENVVNFPMRIINDEAYSKYEFLKNMKRIGYSSKPFCSVRKEILSFLEGPVLNHTAEVDNLLDLKLGMRNRDPSIDVRVIEVMLKTPMRFLANKGRGRALLKDAMIDIVPFEILINETKRGKQAIDWIHRLTEDWNQMIYELDTTFLKKSLVHELIDVSYYNKIIEKNRILEPDKADHLEVRMILWFHILNKFLDIEERR